LEPTRPIQTDELALAQRCVAGDRAAQRHLFEREKRRVHATLYRLVGNNHGIDDHIQDAFVQVFRSLVHYRGEASLSTWVDRCTVRAAYAFFASRKRRPAMLELVPDLASDDPNAEERAMAREATRHFYATLETLEAKQRMAFSLHTLEGLSIAEVAERMESTVIATKTRIWRARRFLEDAARKDPLLRGFVEAAS
jgi:RNA polymerase sigma factor (sigma-70 family)